MEFPVYVKGWKPGATNVSVKVQKSKKQDFDVQGQEKMTSQLKKERERICLFHHVCSIQAPTDCLMPTHRRVEVFLSKIKS